PDAAQQPQAGGDPTDDDAGEGETVALLSALLDLAPGHVTHDRADRTEAHDRDDHRGDREAVRRRPGRGDDVGGLLARLAVRAVSRRLAVSRRGVPGLAVRALAVTRLPVPRLASCRRRHSSRRRWRRTAGIGPATGLATELATGLG